MHQSHSGPRGQLNGYATFGTPIKAPFFLRLLETWVYLRGTQRNSARCILTIFPGHYIFTVVFALIGLCLRTPFFVSIPSIVLVRQN